MRGLPRAQVLLGRMALFSNSMLSKLPNVASQPAELHGGIHGPYAGVMRRSMMDSPCQIMVSWVMSKEIIMWGKDSVNFDGH